jgi:membrane associated rhomboid family serine protease
VSDILEEIKLSFKKGSSLTKLIYINIAVFVFVGLFNVIVSLFNINTFSLINFLAVPDNLQELIMKPWTIISYMFVHEEFLHILFNLLVLFWFGKIFLDYLNKKQLLSVYVLGGIFGALVYIIAFSFIPKFIDLNSHAIGASASVMAVVFAISFYVPENKLNLMFIGQVKLKYIAIAYIFLDVLSLSGDNAGGHFAHLGGALFGYIYIIKFKKGKNIAKGFDRILDSIFSLFSKQKPKMKVSYNNSNYAHHQDIEYKSKKVNEQAQMDKILEKISKSGYNSLSSEEKALLFKSSNKR